MIDRLTDSEKLMYDVMGAIADGNVLFKALRPIMSSAIKST